MTRNMIRTGVLGTVFVLLVSSASFSPACAGDPSPLEGVRRVVFLGDSITYAGGYIDDVEAFLRLKNPSLRCEFLNLGLPSETVSGLSEPGHAGGQFPRPDLHERLDRVLEQTRPDLIVACYGMNDGIYSPYSDARATKFQEGMRDLRERAAQSRARVLQLTPPVFDPLPIQAHTLPAGRAEYRQPFEGYDEVLARYSDWLLAQRRKGWDVIDIHTPMKRHLEAARKRDPRFKLAGDGVHINAEGHWLIAREILLHWGVPPAELGAGSRGAQTLSALPHGRAVLNLVRQRQALLKDAWLTATGHKRPGMSRGLPLPVAKRQGRELDMQIRRLLAPAP